MARAIPIAVVQDAPLPVSDTIDRFAADVQALLARFPQTRMVVHPELHLFGVDSPEGWGGLLKIYASIASRE